jgi:hypothetical protein
MNLFVFLLLVVFVIGMIYVNHTKLDESTPEPTREPVQKSTPELVTKPPKSNWHTYRTRYVVAIIVTLALITATVVEAVFFN